MIAIVGCDSARYAWTLGAGARNANRAWSERRGIFIRLRTSAGIDGYGEASPLPGFSPDDIEMCAEVLTNAWRTCAPLDETAPARDALRASLSGASDRSPAATFALESAMLDVLGKAHGLPAWRMMRDPEDGEPAPAPIATLLSATSAEEAIAQAAAAA
ncbi:MAG: hypothetical protein ACREJX_14015, partial [Polyangiaceae bacterium]